MALNPLTQAQQILKAESEILLKKKLTNEEFLKLINNTERYLDRLQDIQDELEDIDRFYGDIKSKTDGNTQSLKEQLINIQAANNLLSANVDQHAATDGLLKSIDSSSKKVTTTLQNSRKIQDRIVDGYSTQKELTNQIKKNNDVISSISTDRASTLNEMIKLEDISKHLTGAELEIAKEAIKSAEIIIEQLNNQISAIQEINSGLREESDNQDKINNKLGITGKLMRGLSKIPIIGDVVDFNKVNKAMEIEAKRKGSTTFSTLKTGASEFMSQLSSAGPLIALTAIFKILKFIGESIFKADKRLVDLQKSFGASREGANQIVDQFQQIVASSTDFQYSLDDVTKTMTDLATQMGFVATYSDKFTKDIVVATKGLGLSDQESAALAKNALAFSGDVAKTKNNILGTAVAVGAENKLLVNSREILGKVLSTTGTIRANFRGNLTELTKAVTQAKLFGLQLEDVQKTSESLLNFESSIENELKAELLTGKQLNLERARAAALQGDMNTLMQELNVQAGGFDEFMKMNVIQQQALAEAFGFSRAELSDMFFEQKAIEGIRRLGNNEEKDSLLERYNALKAQGRTQEELNQALGEETAQRLEAQSAQEKFQIAMTKLQDAIGLAFKDINPQALANSFNNMVNSAIKLGTAFDVIVKAITGLLLGVAVGSLLPFGPLGTIIGGLIGGIGGGLMADGISTPGYGNRALLTPKGIYSLNNNDTVVATTTPNNVFKGNDVWTGPPGSLGTKQSSTPQVINLVVGGKTIAEWNTASNQFGSNSSFA
jgi:hypothetical protein